MVILNATLAILPVMNDTQHEIEFLPGLGARFRFRCHACGRCCGKFAIVLSPYDILRLRKATGLRTYKLIQRGTVRITREPFNRVFGFAPVADMFEVLGLSQSEAIPVAFLGFQVRNGGHECEFLSPEKDGARLCGIYEDRPGMCRLHPLGCATIAGRRKWFSRRPLCETGDAPVQAVEQWLRASGLHPFLRANSQYLRWMRDLFKLKENFGSIPEEQWRRLGRILYDFDARGADECQPSSGPLDFQVPEDLSMRILEQRYYEWLERVETHYRTSGRPAC